MPHFDEMGFLFNESSTDVNRSIVNTSNNNTINIIKNNNTNNKYVVYKGKTNSGTNKIIGFLKDNVYKHSSDNLNPYLKLIKDFDKGSTIIKPSDLAYLRDLGVYPINRMAILRRFPSETFLPENLEEIEFEPISTIIGWIKPDQNFGKIDFSETWTKTNKRIDVLINEIIKKNFHIDIAAAVPIPEFAQGVLWEYFSRAELAGKSTNEEEVETYDSGIKTLPNGDVWGLTNIPVGDPNLLLEGPFRDPSSQNIQSNFSFTLTTTYEQKIIGDVDPGSAMLDILDNIYAMGTSTMVFYWNEESPIISEAREATNGKSNSTTAWWEFVKILMEKFWEALKGLFSDVANKVTELITPKENPSEAAQKALAGETEGTKQKIIDDINVLFKTILTSTLSIHRFELRGSIELMVGGRYSNTPWHLMLGNPYAPWLSTNHIVVKSCSVETSNELGFNDQPQWLTANFTCEFSRSLGKQELMRMFNNSYRRTYSKPI